MIESLSIAVFAFVFCEILTAPGNILAFYGRWIEMIKKDWIAKPLGECSRCFAGQLALWGYLFMDGYHPVQHVFFIAWTIFFTEIITLIYGRLQMQ